jgi:hypothetical protein
MVESLKGKDIGGIAFFRGPWLVKWLLHKPPSWQCDLFLLHALLSLPSTTTRNDAAKGQEVARAYNMLLGLSVFNTVSFKSLFSGPECG